MTHYEAILGHIKADAPCSYSHVTGWAVSQGFGGSKMVRAISKMVKNRTIGIITEDDLSITVELLKD
jgi:hypothetical protein